MKRHAVVALTLLIFSLNFSIGAASAKDKWTRVRSKNFTLVGNAGERDIRKVALRLEQFRDVFSRLLTKAQLTSPVPTTVVVFKSDGYYKPFKPLYRGKPMEVAGYFQSGPDVNYITLTTEARAENPYGIIFHEFVHMLVGNTVTRAPIWFNEGLAEYYSTFDISDDDKKVTLGKPIAHHVFQLREKFMPLQDLFAVGHDSPAYNERDKRGIFYAESWALMHYLILGNKGARLDQLGRFINSLSTRQSVEDSFRGAFQTDFATMQKELQRYVQNSSYPIQQITFSQKVEFDAEMASEEISEAEANSYLGDLLLHIRRLDAAEARLKQALALDDKLASAHASLGMLRVRQNNFAEARQHLERAVAADSRNHLAHYYYALALSRDGAGGQLVAGYPADDARVMRAELRKAIELAPNFPESYRLLAFVNLVTGEQLDESITMLRQALKLAPSRHDFLYILAQIYLRKQQFKEARAVLQSVIRNSAEPQLRTQAESLHSSIVMMEAQEAHFKSQQEELAKEDGNAGRREATSAGTAELSTESFKPTLKRRVAGERVRGTLVRVECPNQGVVLHVKSGERVFKLHNAAFENIQFTSYTPDVGGEISCGARMSARHVVVTYRAAMPKAGAKFDGEALVVDFVPEDLEVEN
ncbi:MAG: tetratricopeptide repeat protein [Pyrinomonadaceae bacterium]